MISERIRRLLSSPADAFDWTRGIIVVGAAAALLMVCVVTAAPQLVGLGGAQGAYGRGLHKLAATKPTTTTTPAPTTTTVAPTTTTTPSGGSTQSTPEPPPPLGAVSPPSTINATCATDVTKLLNHWLNSLPKHSFVYDPPGSCYLINEGINLWEPKYFTIEGGTFEMQGWGALSRIGLNVIGGTNVTFEYLTIIGPDTTHVYNKSVEFQGGIELQGTINSNINNVKIFDVRGDGITLVPLRAFEVGNLGGGGEMIRPVENLNVSHVYIDGTGRMGISLAAVNGAYLSDVNIRNVATDDFDFEADQSTEGAENVTINGCTVGAKGYLFVSNQGLGGGGYTGNIVVENCTEENSQGGVSVLVEDPPQSVRPRGPFTFINDNLQCGNSAETSCILVNHGKVSFTNTTLTFSWTPSEPVYNINYGSTVSFTNVTAEYYKDKGESSPNSDVSIVGGTWKPEAPGQTGAT